MANRGNGGGLTAWKGSSLYCSYFVIRGGFFAFGADQVFSSDGPDTFGVYQANGRIVRADDALPELDLSKSLLFVQAHPI